MTKMNVPYILNHCFLYSGLNPGGTYFCVWCKRETEFNFFHMDSYYCIGSYY